MASWVADKKPAKRHKASAEEWRQIREYFQFATCVCCGLAAESLHHIVPKSQRGSDIIENLAPLCGDGVRGCHGKLECHSPGWERVAAAVRQYVISDPARRRYAEEHLGDFFNRRYPALDTTDERFAEAFRRVYAVHQTPKDAA